MLRISGRIDKRKDNGKSTFWARIIIIDPRTRQRREKRQKADSRAHAAELRDRLVAEARETGGKSLEHQKTTLVDLADYYRTEYLTPIEYERDAAGEIIGRRSGLREKSRRTVLGQLEMLRGYFGATPLRAITYEDLRRFRTKRENTATKSGGQRTRATVNRELSLLRTMFRVARRARWITSDPFDDGEPLILAKFERHRDRTLSWDEERRLLDACASLCVNVK